MSSLGQTGVQWPVLCLLPLQSSFICPCVHLFVCPLPNSGTRYFKEESIDLAADWQKGHEGINFWGQEVKGQGHTRPKIKVTWGQRLRSHEVKGQGHMRSKVKITQGQRSRSHEAKGQGHMRSKIKVTRGQRSRSHEAKVRFWHVAEASLSTPYVE